ncbi:unnamed protein product [Schistocephalus solidus]|uniref:EF-hand domain-containing protein n=1 Tax=Schistocephalus solidus TaxID=70667 RepID=A0A183SYW5_SCHSO|nr:unnamed protein product [Schistocephalus solidus]
MKRQRLPSIVFVKGLPNFAAPSVFNPYDPRLHEARKQARPKEFIRTVLSSVDTSSITKRRERLNSHLSLVIKPVVDQCEQDDRIHFSNPEVSILLQMFYRLVGSEHRDLTANEFVDFLHATLGISKPQSLVGLHRAATRIAHRTRRLGWNRTVSDFEFVLFLSYLLRGSLAERAELAFYALDQDGDGVLRRNVELTNFLKGSFDLSITVANPELEGEVPVRDTVEYISRIILDGRPEGIQLYDFIELVEKQPWILESLLPCLPDELQNISFQKLQGPSFELPLIDTPSPKPLSAKAARRRDISWYR